MQRVPIAFSPPLARRSGCEMSADEFDKARSVGLNQTECGHIYERAQDEAASLRIHRPHAAWEQEANAWQRLSDAAYACEAILVRRALAFNRGGLEEEQPR